MHSQDSNCFRDAFCPAFDFKESVAPENAVEVSIQVLLPNLLFLSFPLILFWFVIKKSAVTPEMREVAKEQRREERREDKRMKNDNVPRAVRRSSIKNIRIKRRKSLVITKNSLIQKEPGEIEMTRKCKIEEVQIEIEAEGGTSADKTEVPIRHKSADRKHVIVHAAPRFGHFTTQNEEYQ